MNITLEPSPSEWRVRRRAASHLGAAVRASRAHEGGPAPRAPTVASGHQAAIWHAGIAAKLFATLAAARATDARALWLVVDNDDAPVDAIGVAVANDEGLARRVELTLSGAAGGRSPRSSAFEATARDVGASTLAPPFELKHLERVCEAINAHRDAPSAGHQVTRAAIDLLGVDRDELELVAVSEIAQTGAFRVFVRRMFEDPEACATAYNRAVHEYPDAGLTPLVSHPARGWELPVWRVDGSNTRRRVFSGDALGGLGPVLPRALSLTAFARTELCDLFVHGTGGAAYDGATEHWMSSWQDAELVPIGVATATVYPEVEGERPDDQSVARAVWRAHHARHTPALLADGSAQDEKNDLISRIAESADPTQRQLRFNAMHRLLERTRIERAPALSAIEREAARLAALADEQRVLMDRTWAAPLLGERVVEALREDVDRAFGRVDAHA